ncbi:hypothetical protein Tco_1580894, partial [Tanacetum coccineum]
SVTTTALSTTLATASSIPPISIDDYEITGADGQEGAGAMVKKVPVRVVKKVQVRMLTLFPMLMMWN